MRKFVPLGALILTWLTPLTLVLAPATAPAHAESRLPAARDLAAEAASGARDGRALLVLFSERGCPWCERARSEFLLPMQRNEDYQSRIVFRQIDVDADSAVLDFRGRATTHADFARTQGVRMYPTVMLFGPNGERLAEPLVGFTGSDFYGAYLDRRIDQAAGKLRGK